MAPVVELKLKPLGIDGLISHVVTLPPLIAGVVVVIATCHTVLALDIPSKHFVQVCFFSGVFFLRAVLVLRGPLTVGFVGRDALSARMPLPDEIEPVQSAVLNK